MIFYDGSHPTLDQGAAWTEENKWIPRAKKGETSQSVQRSRSCGEEGGWKFSTRKAQTFKKRGSRNEVMVEA